MATGRVTRLGQSLIGTGTATTLYTVPSDRLTMLRDVFICNTTANSRTYTVYLVKSGESPSNANTIIFEGALAGQTNANFRYNVPMVTGDSYRVVSDQASALSCYVSGTEYEGLTTSSVFYPKRLVQAVCPNGSASTVYTVTAGKRAIIKDILIANLTASTPTFTIDIVPSGGSISDTTKIYDAYAMTANQYLSPRVSLVMHEGDTIRLNGNTTNGVSVNIHGAEWAVS